MAGVDRKRALKVKLAAVGLGAGFASSFLGIGGGLIIVPALAAFFGFPLKRAIGTSLATIVLVSAAGVAAESWVKAENIHWGAAAVLSCGALAGSWIGVLLLARFPVRPLKISLVALLLLAAAKLAEVPMPAPASAFFPRWSSEMGMAVAVAVGIAAGIASSLFGIGGGIIAVPGLTILFADVPFHEARATSLAMIVPTSLLGSLLHFRLGTVDGRAAGVLLPPALMGALLGVLSANRLSEQPLRWSFACFLIFAAWRLARSPARDETESAATR